MNLNSLSGAMRAAAGAIVGIVLLIAAIVQGYLTAGWVGGALPSPYAEARATRGITIHVEDNGIHSGIVFPKAQLSPELIARFAAADLADPRFAAHRWVAIGWGDRAFYLGTPSWADLEPRTAAAAAIGSDSVVMHVEHVPAPRAGSATRRVVLRPEQFARLVAFVRASLGEGRAVHGYGGWDAFYPARGRYSAIRTCNAWTGDALRAAGVPMGRWTPFSGTVMWWL